MAHQFLFELGTEELPPRSLKNLAAAFYRGVTRILQANKLAFGDSRLYCTPRRIAIVINALDENTPLTVNKVWGPPAKVAFDSQGKPTKAAQAFAKKNGIALDDLATENDGKQEKLVCMSKNGGEATSSMLGNIVREALAELPIDKRMRWGASREEFVRPVHWVLMLLDNQVMDEEILGIKADRYTVGHRFHSEGKILIEDIDRYESILREQGKVIADFEKRRAMIKSQVEAQAQQHQGRAVIDEDLLDEVTALVEWPVALTGQFETRFLSVPGDALISSMKEHQKYFHVVDDTGALLPLFITVSNIDSKAPEKVIDGNERVIRPRLADAAFFFETDKKSSLESRREKLKSVVFQAKLGSVFDKTERIKRLAAFIAKQLGIDTSQAERAAALCKSDLVSLMVYEFPDMQGIAGYHYALHGGEDHVVAEALREQYLPRFAGDAIPASDVGAVIALADRIDTLTGIFGIGEKPSGSKDPFALRRASLGVLRILVEKSYDLDLRELISFAAKGFADLPSKKQVIDEVLAYCLDRFKAWYEEENIATEIFQSVHAKRLTVPLDIHRRVHAVAAFARLPQAQSLAAANKRVSNILAKQADEVGIQVNDKLLMEKAETRLAKELSEALTRSRPLVEKNAYTEALSELADLKNPVDDFFDNVMVMTDDNSLRQNRLALLSQLRSVFLEVADISHLVVKT